jgi:hypothetical protein
MNAFKILYTFIITVLLLIPVELIPKIIVEKTCTIQEDEDYLIQRISNVDISPDGKSFLLSDIQSGIIGQFEMNNGKLKNFLAPKKELSDIFTLTGTKAMKTIIHDDYQYITIQRAGELNPAFKDENYQKNTITNSFSISKYFKNGIISLTRLNVPKVSPELDAIVLEPAIEFFCFNNNLKNIKAFPLHQQNKDVPPWPNSSNFCYFKNYFYITSFDNVRYLKSKKYDSLPILTVYDKNANFIKIKRYIPYLYEYSKLGYKLTGQSILLASDGEDLYSSHSCVDYIDFLNKSYHLKLKGLPYANKEMFDKLINYCEKKGSNDLNVCEICTLLPLWIKNLIPIHKGIGVLSQLFEVKEKEYATKELYLQLYKKTGELLKQDTIANSNTNGILEYVTFNNKLNKLILFRKDKIKGWTMEVAKWE